MKTVIALAVVVILLSAWPPKMTLATITADHLQDSIVKLRHYADSQSVSNMDKIQELQIKTLEAKILEAKEAKMKKVAWLKVMHQKFLKWRTKKKRDTDYKITYRKKK